MSSNVRSVYILLREEHNYSIGCMCAGSYICFCKHNVQGFPISIKGGGEFPLPYIVGGWEILLGDRYFVSGSGNLWRSDFDHSNLFQS